MTDAVAESFRVNLGSLPWQCRRRPWGNTFVAIEYLHGSARGS